MPVHVYVFLLVVCLLLCLVLLWRHDWLHHQPSHAQAGRRRPLVPRLLKSRSPDDCPACSHAYTAPSGAGPATLRPWSQVQSRRGAPKRIPTEGFACPNRQCAYLGNTDAHMHALVGDGKHGRAEQLQTFRSQACRTTFSARRDTPLDRLKTPWQQVAVVLSALAEGLDLSAAERVFGFRQATITSLSDSCWRARSDVARALLLSSPSPARGRWTSCVRGCAAPHRCVFLWLAIDPRTKLLPVLQLGPRTQHMAHSVLHSLRQMLAPGGLPLFTRDGLNLYFYALTAHFGQWREVRPRGRNVCHWLVEPRLI